MIQSTIDYFKAGLHKNFEEGTRWQNELFNKSGSEFPNRKSGRITGQELPDSIDKNGRWVKHNMSLPEQDHVKVNAIETVYNNDSVNYYIEISCSPGVSVNSGKNDRPITLWQLDELITEIERRYCIDASELELRSVEKSICIDVDNEVSAAFTAGKCKLLVFNDRILYPFHNKDNQLMGYTCTKGHFDFKFYSVDRKYGERLNLFRIERQYKRMQTFKRDTGIVFLNDLRCLAKAKKCAEISLKDCDDTIIYDPLITPNRKLSAKEMKLLLNASDAAFWIAAKRDRDKDTYKDWVLTYRMLSDEFGSGIHTKIRNVIISQIGEIETALQKQKLKNSPIVTYLLNGNNRGIVNINTIEILNNIKPNMKTKNQALNVNENATVVKHIPLPHVKTMRVISGNRVSRYSNRGKRLKQAA